MAVLKYTVIRLALFVGLLAVLAYLGADTLLALLGAAVGSMMLSYVLLRGLRTQVAEVIAHRVGQHRSGERPLGQGTLGLDDDAAAEDEALDRGTAGTER